ncbi:hypothetical protein Drorol1_Dr00014932 [Drosera rotundifolia]
MSFPGPKSRSRPSRWLQSKPREKSGQSPLPIKAPTSNCSSSPCESAVTVQLPRKISQRLFVSFDESKAVRPLQFPAQLFSLRRDRSANPAEQSRLRRQEHRLRLEIPFVVVRAKKDDSDMKIVDEFPSLSMNRRQTMQI